jgi:hypothetical protein
MDTLISAYVLGTEEAVSKEKTCTPDGVAAAHQVCEICVMQCFLCMLGTEEVVSKENTCTPDAVAAAHQVCEFCVMHAMFFVHAG